jgi:hypothetical protein
MWINKEISPYIASAISATSRQNEETLLKNVAALIQTTKSE